MSLIPDIIDACNPWIYFYVYDTIINKGAAEEKKKYKWIGEKIIKFSFNKKNLFLRKINIRNSI